MTHADADKSGADADVTGVDADVTGPDADQSGAQTDVTGADVAAPYGQMAIEAAELERWPNPSPDRDYVIDISAPEFTCLCPRSGYPDFATIRLRYVPGEWIVELRSLKLYMNAFRHEAVSHEAVTNRILDELAELLEPRWMQVEADFYPRGNVHTVIRATHRAEGWTPSADVQRELSPS